MCWSIFRIRHNEQRYILRIIEEATIVSKYFNQKWEASLVKLLGVSGDTTVRSLWVVDNPASSYQFQESQLHFSSPTNSHIVDNTININWDWFCPEKGDLGKIRIDYHQHDDILYILNQERRHNPLTVYDVMKQHIENNDTSVTK